MAWTVNYSESALRKLKKLDKEVSRRILDFLDQRIATLEDPRSIGKQLKGNLGSYWSYRHGDYRIICNLDNGELIVLILDIGHRKHIYKELNPPRFNRNSKLS